MRTYQCHVVHGGLVYSEPLVIDDAILHDLGVSNDMHTLEASAAPRSALAITYLNEKALPYVKPLADELEAPIVLPCDVRHPGELEAVFEAIGERWGRLDFALHSTTFAPKDDLTGRLIDSSQEGFAVAMDVSCHSFIRMARLSEPLMLDGGTLYAMSFYGAERWSRTTT